MSSFTQYSATALSASQTVANFEAVRKGHILPKGGVNLSETTGVYDLGQSTGTYKWDKVYAEGLGATGGNITFSSQVTFTGQATFTGSFTAAIPGLPAMMVCKYMTIAGGNPQVGSSTAEIIQWNTVTMNTLDGGTLTTNQIQLPTGAYTFKAYVQCQISGASPQSVFYLFNATSSLTVFNCGGPHSHSAAEQIQEIEMHMAGNFSLDTTSSLEMRVSHTDARTTYFGPNPVHTTTATYNDGLRNVYQQIAIFKVS